VSALPSILPSKAASPERSLLAQPLPLACVALLVLNDHLLKHVFPGLVTGKLSDFAGLFFFPLFLVDLGRWVRPRDPARLLLPCAIATAVVFAAVKTWTPAHDGYSFGLGLLQWPFRVLSALVRGVTLPTIRPTRLVMDATDLIALVSVVAAYHFAWRQRPRS
jgi:hypothetical protein